MHVTVTANDNEHPLLRKAFELLNAEMSRIFAAGHQGELTLHEKQETMDRLGRAALNLPPHATVTDVERALGRD